MKNILHVSTFWLSIIFLCNVQSMQEIAQENMQPDFNKTTEYNDTICTLTSLPKKTLIKIFSHGRIKDIEKSIKNFMQISMTCKKFNTALTFETIGKLHKNYTQKDKDQTLKNLIKEMTSHSKYKIKRLPALIIIYAGADANSVIRNDCLLNEAVNYTDAQMVKILLEHHVDPNTKDIYLSPIFFDTKTIEIAQMFFNSKDFNMHAINKSKNNVLWHLTDVDNLLWSLRKTKKENCVSELIEFYLAQGVDPKKLDGYNSCILHTLAEQPVSKKIKNIPDFLKRSELLLNAMPGMVNILNNSRKTPIDIAQQSLEEAEENKEYSTPEAFEQLIALFRKYGGLTAKELQKTSMVLLLHNDDHLGDLSVLPHDVRKYIVKYMNTLNEKYNQPQKPYQYPRYAIDWECIGTFSA